jgi:hypothetical protein|tara:strand:+ start:224 stop:1447 length:1224 start_codon:yes stop_codon:yes gene_type:complete
MKNLTLVVASLLTFCATAQNVGINNTGATPNANAILDIDDSGNDKGILIPRISSGQRAGIAGLGLGEEGLTVYDETTNSYWLWDGVQWVQFMMEGNTWTLVGNPGTNAATNFLGTTDATDFVIRTNNAERVRVTSAGNVGIGTPTPAYTLQTGAGGTISANDGYFRQAKGIYLQDWDDNTGGIDDKYRLLGRDGSWQFYNGGVVVGNYGNGTWTDLADGYLIVENRVGIATTAPTQALDVNGSVRIRGGGPAQGDVLMSQDGLGNATWAGAGYGLIPIGSIVAWHKNAGSIPGLPAGWVECNGGTFNGITVPNLNGTTTSKSGDPSIGRFLRGSTTSGLLQTDQSNNLRWVNHDDVGNGDTEDFLDDDGTTITIRNYSTSGDRFQAYLEGVETRVTNMSVVWIIRVI